MEAISLGRVIVKLFVVLVSIAVVGANVLFAQTEPRTAPEVLEVSRIVADSDWSGRPL